MEKRKTRHAILLIAGWAWCMSIQLACAGIDHRAVAAADFNAGNYAKALEAYKAILKDRPNDWEIMQSIASCENRLGRFDASIIDLQRSIAAGGLHATQCTIMACALEGLGQPSKALRWLELACSVEPAQAMNPGIQAAIRRLQDPATNPTGSPNAPDYLSGLTSVTRWQQGALPLRVYVRKNIQIPDYYENYRKIVRGCLKQWCHATDNVVSYQLVNDKHSANLICDYTDNQQLVSLDHEPGLDGSCETRIRFKDNTTDWANITLLVRDGARAPFRNSVLITKAFLHELGHALGMHGHSPNPRDMMFLAATPELTCKLTDRDETTIRKIYPIPAGAQKLQRTGDDAFKSKNFAKALASYAAAWKKHPKSWLIAQSIANCHMHIGHYNEAIAQLRKSLELGGMHTSQCQTMAAIYHRLGEPDNEAAWLNVACSIDPVFASDAQIRAKIRHLEDPIIHPTGSLNSPDYLASAFHIDKWRKADMPLKVYIEPNPELPDFYSTFRDIVRKSLDEWCKATNGAISFQFTDKPDGAQLLWAYVDRPEISTSIYERGTAGATDLAVHLQDGRVTQAQTIIVVKDQPGAPFRKLAFLNAACLHELGHALGIRGHSPNPKDIMFPNATLEDWPILTQRDKNTMRKMYSY